MTTETPAFTIDMTSGPAPMHGTKTGYWLVRLADGTKKRVWAQAPYQFGDIGATLEQQRAAIIPQIADALAHGGDAYGRADLPRVRDPYGYD